MQGWVYKTPLKRAIEAARRQGSGEVAKASPEVTPAEPPLSFARTTGLSRPTVYSILAAD